MISRELEVRELGFIHANLSGQMAWDALAILFQRLHETL